jgi:hypothetical protein
MNPNEVAAKLPLVVYNARCLCSALIVRSDKATGKAAIHKPEILMEEKTRKKAMHQSSSTQEGAAQSYDDENPIGAKMCPLHEFP